jgi:hypothetical protein
MSFLPGAQNQKVFLGLFIDGRELVKKAFFAL